MNIVVEVPPNLPDAVQRSPDESSREAGPPAMPVRLCEMGRLSSGMAAALAGGGRVEFLLELRRPGAPVMDLRRGGTRGGRRQCLKPGGPSSPHDPLIATRCGWRMREHGIGLADDVVRSALENADPGT